MLKVELSNNFLWLDHSSALSRKANLVQMLGGSCSISTHILMALTLSHLISFVGMIASSFTPILSVKIWIELLVKLGKCDLRFIAYDRKNRRPSTIFSTASQYLQFGQMLSRSSFLFLINHSNLLPCDHQDTTLRPNLEVKSSGRRARQQKSWRASLIPVSLPTVLRVATYLKLGSVGS